MFAIHMDLWIFWNLLCNFLGTGLAQQHENPYVRILLLAFSGGIWPHVIADRAKEEWLSICVPCCWLCDSVRIVETGFLPRFTHLYFLTSPMCVERGQKSDQGRRGIQVVVGDPQMESGVHLTQETGKDCQCVSCGEMNTPCPWFAGDLGQHVAVKAPFVVCWGLWGSQTWGRWATCSRSWKFSWGSR